MNTDDYKKSHEKNGKMFIYYKQYIVIHAMSNSLAFYTMSAHVWQCMERTDIIFTFPRHCIYSTDAKRVVGKVLIA
jgi:hypothetical protein